MKVMTKPRFLEDAISKSFKAQEENKQIMRENQALNKKLMRIAGKQVREAWLRRRRRDDAA